MQVNSLLKWVLCLTFLISFTACQDHSQVVTPTVPGASASRLRVKTLTQDLSSSTAKVTAFTYDAQNRLISLISYQSPDSTVNWVEKSRYQYDAQNRLVLHQYQRISRPNSIFGPFADQHQFIYTGTGQLGEIRYSYNGNSQPGQTIVDLTPLSTINTLTIIGYPLYNAANQVTGLKKIYYSQGRPTTLEADNQYTYSGSNMIFSRTVYTSNQSTTPYQLVEQTDIAYDGKINPFYGVYMVPKYFGGISDTYQNVATFSPNNILTLGGVSFRYDYNAANLPTVRYTYTDKLVETLRFEYESY